MAGLGRMKYMVLCNLPYRLREIAGRIAKKCRRRKDRSLEAKLEDIRNLLIYNHPISSVPPATGKLRLLQDGNTVLLALFARKCRENGLRYWLDYGTLLGAVRHRGFIPWDDDLDVSMMRPEFDRLLELLPVLFPREEGFTWNRHAFLQIGYEGTPLNLDVYPYHFYAESLSSPEQHGKLDRLLSGFKKDVVLVGSRMNLTDGQVQEKIRQDILEGRDAAGVTAFSIFRISYKRRSKCSPGKHSPGITGTRRGREARAPTPARARRRPSRAWSRACCIARTEWTGTRHSRENTPRPRPRTAAYRRRRRTAATVPGRS